MKLTFYRTLDSFVSIILLVSVYVYIIESRQAKLISHIRGNNTVRH